MLSVIHDELIKNEVLDNKHILDNDTTIRTTIPSYVPIDEIWNNPDVIKFVDDFFSNLKITLPLLLAYRY